ncbi:MAG: hypothetical protein R2725_04595 [Solirubrobacterales bacterium]
MDHLFRDDFVAFLLDHVEHRLDADELGERRRHHRLAELLADPDDLVDHRGEALRHPVLVELVLQRPGHPARQLVAIGHRPVLVGDPGLVSHPLRFPREVLGDGRQLRLVEVVGVPHFLDDLDHRLGRGQRGAVGERQRAGVDDLDPGLDPLQIDEWGEAGGVVAVQLEPDVAGRLLQGRQQSRGPLRGEHAGGVLDVDRPHPLPGRHFAGAVGEELVGMDVDEAVHDRRHHLAADPPDRFRLGLHHRHVVEAVEQPVGLDPVLDQGLDPEVEHRVRDEAEAAGGDRPHPGPVDDVGRALDQVVECRPGVVAGLPQHHHEEGGAGQVDDPEAGAVEVGQGRGRLVGAHPHPPEALGAVAQGLVDELDVGHRKPLWRGGPAGPTPSGPLPL